MSVSYILSIAFVLMSLLFFGSSIGSGADSKLDRVPAPRVNQDSWVMIEVWPDVQSITLAAYFLDSSFERNKRLCEATKTVFDRDQEVRSKAQKKKFSTYWLCMSVSDAIQQGYVQK
jgi:hypothetical protein